MHNQQQGQTLIETIVAVFILIMGITAALGLANYSLNVTNTIRQQTIAMGLAREGIEVVKIIRDTNWLRVVLSPNCYNYETGDSNAYCYPRWRTPHPSTGGQAIAGSTTGTPYIIYYDPNQQQPWRITGNSTSFGLTSYDSSTSDLFYTANTPVLATAANSGFARKITITTDDFAPFDQDNSTRLKVTSQVWWSSSKCPMTDDVDPNSACLITLETYLTNWKNY